jgi:hypothetical protein
MIVNLSKRLLECFHLQHRPELVYLDKFDDMVLFLNTVAIFT